VIILAIDCAIVGARVAIVAADRILSQVSFDEPRGQTERLVPMIEAALRSAGIGYADLDRIAVTTGPGSFTGIRVGLATARSIALVTRCPVVGVSTLEALAVAGASGGDRMDLVVAAIDSRRGDLFLQTFAIRGAGDVVVLSDPAVCDAGAAQRIILDHLASGRRSVLVGDGWSTFGSPSDGSPNAGEIGRGPTRPDPAVVARIAAGRDVAGMPAPIYLRPADAIPARPVRPPSP
jgi:tRNA threonylcarbamoyladenosine biosynthesis protein TsaB